MADSGAMAQNNLQTHLHKIDMALQEAAQGLQALASDKAKLNAIAASAQLMAASIRAGGGLLSIGNGGSMCDAMHFAEEFAGRFRQDRPAVRAIAISDAGFLTCAANDYGYEEVFARGVEAYGKKGDVLLAISTSGTSRNVIKAAAKARDLGISVIALTGRPGSVLGGLATIEICTPAGKYADRVQELHIKVIHILIELVEDMLFARQG